MTKIRELHKQEKGFLKSEVCRRCYLPRKTQDDIHTVEGRDIVVKNYTKNVNTK